MKERNSKRNIHLLRRQDNDDSVGVFDIGSNSVRFVAYDLSFHPPLPFFNEKETCGLGADLEHTGMLDPQGMKRATKALKHFIRLADMLNVHDLRAVATAAVRDAKDGPDFAQKLSRKLDLDIRVLSGEEESFYSAQGVLAAFPDASGVIADLGGGSIELATIGDGKVDAPVSLPLGVLRLAAHKKDLRTVIRKGLATVGTAYKNTATIYAIGGTWRAYAEAYQIDQGVGLPHSHGYTMDAEAACRFADTIAGETAKALVRYYAVDKKRAALLPSAGILMQELLETTGADTIIFSNYGLRDGIVHEIAAKQD